MTTITSGADVNVMWGKETEWGTAVATATVFGDAPNLDSFSINKNFTKNIGLGNREGSSILIGKFEGMLTVSFNLTNGNYSWLELVWPTITGTPTDKWASGNTIASATIRRSMPVKTVATLETYAGCVCTNFDIKPDESSNSIKVTLQFAYKSYASAGGTALAPTVTGTVLTFAEASFTAGAVTYVLVNSASISVATNVSLKHGLGSVTAQGISVGAYDYSIDVDHTMNSTDELVSVVNTGTALAGKLAIKTGTTTNTNFVFTGGAFTTYDSGSTDAEDVMESVSIIPLTMYAELEDTA